MIGRATPYKLSIVDCKTGQILLGLPLTRIREDWAFLPKVIELAAIALTVPAPICDPDVRVVGRWTWDYENAERRYRLLVETCVQQASPEQKAICDWFAVSDDCFREEERNG